MKYSKGNVARADHNGHTFLEKRMRETLNWFGDLRLLVPEQRNKNKKAMQRNGAGLFELTNCVVSESKKMLSLILLDKKEQKPC